MSPVGGRSSEVCLLVIDEGKMVRSSTVAFNVPHTSVPPTTAETGLKPVLKRPPTLAKCAIIRPSEKMHKLVNLKVSGPRIRSASAGRDRKSDLQARYWGLLFENLRRAVDEIYQTCETDESIEEIKEAIMILETCTKDFRNLIEWLRLKWNYEATPPPQRPTSLAWEVRKSSPSKPSCALVMGRFQKNPASLAKRVLNFDDPGKSLTSPLVEKMIEEDAVIGSTAISCSSTDPTASGTAADAPRAKRIVKCLSVAGAGSTSPATSKTSPTPGRRLVTAPKAAMETSKTGAGSKSSGETGVQRFNSSTRVGPPSKPKAPVSVSTSSSAAVKDGKNALNTEVKCQSWAQKVQTSLSRMDPAVISSTTCTANSSPTTSAPTTSATNTPSTAASTLKFLKPTKTDSLKRKTVREVTVAKPSIKAGPTEVDDGWETVRGRPRSRTSPNKTHFMLTRASTLVYPSKTDVQQKRSSLSLNPVTVAASTGRKSAVAAKCRPSGAQSLPSLSMRELERNERWLAEGSSVPRGAASSINAIESPPTVISTTPSIEACCLSEEELVSSPDQLVEEEAEMARREEALTMEEENLQREMRETERSDNEGDEWEDPSGSITPATTPEVDAVASSHCDDGPTAIDVELDGSCDRVVRDALEDKYEFVLEDCSWADRMEMLDQLEELTVMDARQPGRALQVHEKLSSPSRRRLAKPCEAFQQHEAKQLRAQLHRAALQEKKACKRRELAKRIDEVRLQKEQLLEQRRLLLERKMKQAEAKRLKHLADIVKKAHDEEEKLKEIAFINELEAQNKRHDFITHIQTQEERIQGLQEERLRRQEERKLAKEAAVEERKRALEAERLAKMALLQEKRRQREERIDREQQEKEKERLEMAREKQRDREERLSALQAAHQASLKGLQQRLQKKQEESARRHEDAMEQIRQKALELSILRFSSAGDDAPRLVNYETTRVCTLCDTVINSEVILMSHLRGRTHMEALRNHHGGKEPSREQSETSNLKFIVEAESKKTVNERQKRQRALKKRSKKLRQMLLGRPESPPKAAPVGDASVKTKMAKIIRELERERSGGNVERQWAELSRLLDKGTTNDQQLFCSHQGVSLVVKSLTTALEEHGSTTSASARLVVTTANVIRSLAHANLVVSVHLVTTKTAPLLLELLVQRLEVELLHALAQPEESLAGSVMESSGSQNGGHVSSTATHNSSDSIATAVMNAWIALAEPLSSCSESALDAKQAEDVFGHIIIIISYAVSLGLVDRLARHIGGVRGPLENHSPANEFLLAALKFLTSLVNLLYRCRNNANGSNGHRKSKGKTQPDVTQLIEAFQITESAGTVNVVNALYGLLLHQGVPSRSHSKPPQLLDNASSFTLEALQLLHRLALLDLNAFQRTVGAEGVSLEFRHISSYLLWYGVHWPSATHMLHLTILCIGYFAARDTENQMILQSGHMPSVLQQLCRLPFQYFSEKQLQAVLFPTLLACCHGNASNRAILEKEMSYQMLDDFVNSEDGRDVHLVQVVLATANGCGQ